MSSSNSTARVIAVDRGQMLLQDEMGVFRAKLSGKFIFESNASAEYPCVGDWVFVEKTDADEFGLIQGIAERKTSSTAQRSRKECRVSDDCGKCGFCIHRSVVSLRFQYKTIGALLGHGNGRWSNATSSFLPKLIWLRLRNWLSRLLRSRTLALLPR